MQVSVKTTGKLEREVRVELPEDQVSTEVNNRLQRLTKTTRIQGFRPGKVPLKVIEKRYGVQVRKEVVGELVQSSFYEALSQKDLKPAGTPKIDDITDEAGRQLSYTATFEVYPDVALKPMNKIKLEKPVCHITDEDISKMIEVLRKQRRELKPVDRAAQKKDIVDINFEGTIKGEAFEGNKAESYKLELGSNSFIEGFEEGLVGHSAGDEVTLKLTFPKDYGKEELKGEAVEFKVRINTVSEPVLPEVDAGFMEAFGVKDGKEDSFRAELRRHMEQKAESTIRRQLKDRVFNALHEKNKVELPRNMVDNEREHLQLEMTENLKRQGIDSKTVPEVDTALFTEQAEKRVALRLIIGELVKQNELKAEQSDIRAMVEKVASGYQDPDAVLNWYYSDQKNLAEIEAAVLEEEVVDWVLSNAKVTEKTCTFDEIMNNGQTLS